MSEFDQPSAAVSVLLAEFTALRGQINQLATTSQATLALYTTTASFIAGLTLGDKVDGKILLLIPLLSCAMGIFYADHIARIRLTADYIGRYLQPLLAEYMQDDRLLMWENYNRARKARLSRGGAALAASLVFPLSSTAALAATAIVIRTPLLWTLWPLAAAALLVQLGSWVLTFKSLRSGELREARSGPYQWTDR